MLIIYEGIIPPLKSIVKKMNKVIGLRYAKSRRESGYATNPMTRVDKNDPINDVNAVIPYPLKRRWGTTNIASYDSVDQFLGISEYPNARISASVIKDDEITRMSGIMKNKQHITKYVFINVCSNRDLFLFSTMLDPFLKTMNDRG